VPAAFPSIYVGNNGDIQNRNDPPKGSYTTKPGDALPRQISNLTSAVTTAAFNSTAGDFSAVCDIWLAPAAPTAEYTDALGAFVQVWLYTPTNRPPLGTSQGTKTISGTSYEVFAASRGSGTDPLRPVISYVATSPTTSKTFDLKAILSDAIANGYGVRAIPLTYYVTDIFFGFQIWSGVATYGLSVTNFSVDIQ
jgi:hypothetical protein